MRVRFAPSPTGHLHMGGARTALFNWLLARHHDGRFLLRIEDTDRSRSSDWSVQGILEALSWLGIDWDEEPVFQSDRHEAHLDAARRLETTGHAYRCYCTRERLEAMREAQRARGEKPRYDRHCLSLDPSDPNHPGQSPETPYVVRFKTPREGGVAIDDLVKGSVSVGNDQLDDLVIVRSDGTPTYNFVVVVDDAEMGITHVVRGDDHLNNTFRQVHIYRALGLTPPAFAHLPLIKGLSKRLGSASVQAYRDLGYLSEAVVNYIARLGWSHGDDEIFDRDALIGAFDLDGVSASPAAFDENKLAWLNQHYLKNLPSETVAERLVPFLEAKDYPGVVLDWRVVALVEALRERARTLVEMADASDFAYLRPSDYDRKAVKKWIRGPALEVLGELLDALRDLDTFAVDSLESLVKALCERRGLKLGKVAQPIRICLTGRSVSPPLYDTMRIVGHQETVTRIEMGIDALERIKASA